MAVGGLAAVDDGGVVEVAVGIEVWVEVGAEVAVGVPVDMPVGVGVALDTLVGVSKGLRGRQPAASSPAAQALICWRNLRREIILFMLYRLYQVSNPNAIAGITQQTELHSGPMSHNPTNTLPKPITDCIIEKLLSALESSQLNTGVESALRLKKAIICS